MKNYIMQNKDAWEHGTYDSWIKHSGTPSALAAKIVADPSASLRRYARYFDRFDGVRVANICGSCGKKAVPLAVLGADVTVFDISAENQRYATELSEAAHAPINYVLCNVLDIDMDQYGGKFDVVFMEGGILHYFHDLTAFMSVMHTLLKPGGKMICSDFHPFTKIADILEFGQPTMSYFSTDVFEGDMPHARFHPNQTAIPKCSYRKYTVSEIINAVLHAGFILERFDEHPAWTNPNLPGEFTILASKML